MQNLYHKMTKTQSRSENLIKYSCLFASWIVLFHKKQLTKAPLFRAAIFAPLLFKRDPELELDHLPMYLLQDYSKQDYLICFCDTGRVLAVLWYKFCLFKMRIS